MSLSRHFQFVLSQDEAAACRRFAKDDYFATHTMLRTSDQAHVRNVLDRLTQAYETAGMQGLRTPYPIAKRYNTSLPKPEKNL